MERLDPRYSKRIRWLRRVGAPGEALLETEGRDTMATARQMERDQLAPYTDKDGTAWPSGGVHQGRESQAPLRNGS